MFQRTHSVNKFGFTCTEIADCYAFNDVMTSVYECTVTQL
jgi:hypothetical protein